MNMMRGQRYNDFTWDGVTIANWTCIEAHGAIICACLMTFKPLIVRMFPRVGGSRAGSPYSWREKRANAGSPGGSSYKRPLTIGTTPSRGRAHRDSSGSEALLFCRGQKSPVLGSKASLGTYSNTSHTDVSGRSQQGSRTEYRLEDLEAGVRSADLTPSQQSQRQHEYRQEPMTPPPSARIRPRPSIDAFEDIHLESQVPVTVHNMI
jgi:hypothetical protein